MKLLLLCPHFEPDLHAATGEVMTRLAHALADRGHRVDVVTSLPWYHAHDVEPEWRGRPWRVEQADHGRIVRVWPFPTDKTSVPARAVGFLGLTGLVAAAAVTGPRPDAVIGMSPPIFLGEAAALAARRFGVPWVFNVQDIFPDVAVDLGALTNQRVIAAASRYERRLYRRADAVSVLSRDQAANVRAKLPADQRAKVVEIHNFVDTERVRPVDRATEYRGRYGLGDRLVVMYSGNVGLSQSFELVRGAADRFAGRRDVVFVINGEGAARADVDAWAADRDNVVVADFQPREAVPDTLGSADIHLILLKPGLAKSSTPSKLYGILAAGRPVVASIDAGSEVAVTVEEADAGLVVDPAELEPFCVALTELLDDADRRTRLGNNGRRHVETLLTPAAQAAAYEELLQQLTPGGSSADG